MKLKDVHDKSFESDIESMLNDIKKYLTKEYKKVTGDSLSLTKDGEADIMVQNVSRVRTIVQAHQFYKIGGLKDVVHSREEGERKVDWARNLLSHKT